MWVALIGAWMPRAACVPPSPPHAARAARPEPPLSAPPRRQGLTASFAPPRPPYRCSLDRAISALVADGTREAVQRKWVTIHKAAKCLGIQKQTSFTFMNLAGLWVVSHKPNPSWPVPFSSSFDTARRS